MRYKGDVAQKKSLILFLIVLSVFFIWTSTVFAEQSSYDCNAEENKEIRTSIKLKLERKWKKKKREIKKDISSRDGQLKVKLEFFAPKMTPPKNLGIGKCVSAETGRLAIEKAFQYNRGIDFVIMQEFLPHHWAMFGTTDLAELTFIKITSEDLSRLADPSLSTEQFQDLYRQLSTLKERTLPFGMGIKKLERGKP